MEQAKNDPPKLPDMVMCGDHPSFTKTELNVKDAKPDEKDKKVVSRISPSSSRTERTVLGAERTRSEQALRLAEARRRARAEADIPPGNRALVQAALGSFRWPPYLLGVWVIVLILTHILHCIVTMLERALPNIRRFCQYFRSWTEDAWRSDSEINQRVYPLALAAVTGLMYTVYFLLYVVYSIALWAIEPLCSDLDDKPSSQDMIEPKVTNYVDEISSKTNVKH